MGPARLLAQGDGAARPERSAGATRAGANQPPSDAVDHYLRGRQHYLAGRYRDALVELKAALELDPNSADLLYNVARVYENLRLFDEAIEYYQRYQQELAAYNADERAKVQKTIRRLQGAKAELEQLQRLEDDQETQDGASTRHVGRADLAFWLTGAASAALLAAGSVTGVLALKRNDDVAAFVVGLDGSLAKRDGLAREADGLALATDVMLASGAAAFTTAVLLFLLRDKEPQASVDGEPGEPTHAREPKPVVAAGFGPLGPLGPQGVQLRVDF